MEPFIGEIKMFGGTFAPRSWAFCDGQLLSISQNQALFSILGTTYGGDGRTTFALPDLRGRVSMHPGSGPGLTTRKLGQKGGAESNSLSNANLPAIPLRVSSANGNTATPSAGSTIAKTVENQGRSANEIDSFNSASPDITLNNASIGGGNSTPVGNIQPYQCVNYIICTYGTYPSRN